MVEGLDAVDGTPVIDVKPYLPQQDAVVDAVVPKWTKKLDQKNGKYGRPLKKA